MNYTDTKFPSWLKEYVDKYDQQTVSNLNVAYNNALTSGDRVKPLKILSILRKNGKRYRYGTVEDADGSIRECRLDHIITDLIKKGHYKAVPLVTLALFKDRKGIAFTYKEFARIKRAAKVRKIKFNLHPKDLEELMIKQDYQYVLTGGEISFNKKDKKNVASLDRIDSSKPYIKGNIQWVRRDINLHKHSASTEEFLNMCREVIDYSNLR